MEGSQQAHCRTAWDTSNPPAEQLMNNSFLPEHIGPRPLKLNSTQRHGLFLKSTCNIKFIDMGQGGINDSDMFIS